MAKTATCPKCGGPKHPLAKHGCRTCMRVQETVCTGCLRLLPRAEFYKRKSNGHIVNPCKACTRTKRKVFAATHKEQEAAYKLRYRQPIRAQEAAKSREYAKTHKRQRLQKLRERRRVDLAFRIECNLRRTLAMSLRRGRADKRGRTLALLGCSIDEFKRHIEGLWTSGMAWENWGPKMTDWHLDHIRPVASFDLCNAEQQELCFHWRNFQPLWGIENVRKSDTWAGTNLGVCGV